jgi:hypothetical protein
MPIRECQINGEQGYKWGEQGKCYIGPNAKEDAIAQGVAIGDFQETYNDYPESAKNNAKKALKWAEKNGWGTCGTQVGKIRANQLANGENISRDTIARMASFKRHQQNKDVPYDKGCGGLMWDAWGGNEGIEWAQRKLKEIDNQKKHYTKINEKYLIVYNESNKLKKMKKNIIEKIIEIFSTEQEVEMNFVDVKTVDGRIMRVSDLAIDADVQEIDADGNLIPVENGDYELESGEIVSVLDGKIAEIASPEEEAEDAVEEEVPVAAQMSSEEVEDNQDLEFESLISNLKELVAEVKALKEGFESIKNENQELKASVEKFAKTPSAEETKKVMDFSKLETKKESNSIMKNILTSKK